MLLFVCYVSFDINLTYTVRYKMVLVCGVFCYAYFIEFSKH